MVIYVPFTVEVETQPKPKIWRMDSCFSVIRLINMQWEIQEVFIKQGLKNFLQMIYIFLYYQKEKKKSVKNAFASSYVLYFS